MGQKSLFSISPEEVEAAEKQIRKIQKEIRFDTRDFPVETIVSRFTNDNFFIPPYQREFIWDTNDQSEFIESVIMGLPIPMMFLAEDEDSRFEIVDGAQRIQTLVSFVTGDLELNNLKTMTTLNHFTFSDLPETQQNKFTSRALRIVILDAETTEDSRRDLFNRINKSGRDLEPSERRRGAFEGAFVAFLEKCAEDRTFRNQCPVSSKMVSRKEPLELVTRFFAYSERYLDFVHDVDQFLDEFVKDNRHKFDKHRFQDEFNRTMNFIMKHFPYGIAKSATAKTTPRVRFEAISVGVNLALRKSPELVPGPISPWLESDEFKKHTTTHASNSAPRLRGRIEYVRDQLLKG